MSTIVTESLDDRLAARVALNDGMRADQAEDLAGEIDRRLSEKLPMRPNVFIDPTQTRPTPPAGTAPPPGRDAPRPRLRLPAGSAVSSVRLGGLEGR